MTTPADKLFIYGTLAPGEENHFVMEPIDGTWVSGSIRGTVLDVGWGGATSGYPGFIPEPGGDEVPGYLFTSKELPANWPMLDDFEGAGYRRCGRYNGRRLCLCASLLSA